MRQETPAQRYWSQYTHAVSDWLTLREYAIRWLGGVPAQAYNILDSLVDAERDAAICDIELVRDRLNVLVDRLNSVRLLEEDEGIRNLITEVREILDWVTQIEDERKQVAR